MHWMWDAMWARIGWALGEIVFVSVIVAVFVVAGAISSARSRKHVREFEARMASSKTTGK